MPIYAPSKGFDIIVVPFGTVLSTTVLSVKYTGFTSMRSFFLANDNYANIPINDDLFTTLLNPNAQIKIAGKLTKLIRHRSDPPIIRKKMDRSI